MNKPVIVLKVGYKKFRDVYDLALKVYNNMDGNTHFNNPQPSLVTVLNASNALGDVIVKWGDTGNRGSHKDHLDVIYRSRLLHSLLTQLGAWCMSSLDPGMGYPAQTTILATSGFPLKNARSSVGRLQAVREFERIFARNVGEDQVKLRWKKPLGVAISTNVKSYIIYRSASLNFSTASIIDCVQITAYKDKPGEGTWYYWVVPGNTNGFGVISERVVARVVSI
jgi:hypothetical protein